jgi:iron(III) transport system permease protein
LVAVRTGREKSELRSPAPVWLQISVALLALLFAMPLLYLIVGNATSEESFLSAIVGRDALLPLGRSVFLGVTVAVAATVLGTGAAWLVTRADVPFRRGFELLLPLPLVVPSFIGAFAFLAAFASGGVLESVLSPVGIDSLPGLNGFAGAFVVLTLFTYPYVYLPVRARLRQLPASLEESSRLLGSGALVTFSRVVLPQIRPAVLAGSLLVFLYTIGDFGVVQLMRYRALTTTIYSTRLFDRPTSLALSLLLGLLALLVVAGERVVAGRTWAGPRGTRPLQVPLRKWRVPGVAALALLLLFALGVPAAVLAWWAVRGVTGGAVTSDVASLAASALNTSFASIAAAAVSIVLVLPVAYLTGRYKSRVGGTGSNLIVAGFALPGLAIALALVSLTLDAPALAVFYQTFPLLVLAYVVHFGAQALRASQVSLGAVPARVEDAARMLGAGRIERFFRAELPLMMPGLLAGAGLVLLSSMKELPASLLLAPPGFQTLAMRVWASTESAYFADASIASLILIALSGVLTWFLVIRRSEVLV